MEKMEVKPSYLKRCIIIQSPLVQLNTPYPSGAYLKSFFSNYNERISCDLYNNHDAGTFRGGNYNRESGNSRGGHFSSVKWIDASNLLFHRIFSPEGLRHIFDSTENKALKMANEAEKNKNERDMLFRKTGIDSVTISTDGDYVAALTELFGRR